MPIVTPLITADTVSRICDQFHSPSRAESDETTVADKTSYIHTCLQNGKYTPMSMPLYDFRYIFELADTCDESDYHALREALAMRVTPEFYDIGLAAFQRHADSSRVEELFDIVLRLMGKLKPAVFSKTIFARCGLPIKRTYANFFRVTVEENALPDALLQRYQIEPDNAFAGCLRLSYLAQCSNENIGDMNHFLPQGILQHDLRFVRAAIKNYMQLVPFTDIPVDIVQAIYDRLMQESKDETLGMTRDALEHIRSYKFRSILLGIFDKDSPKLKVYSAMPGSILKIIQYEHDYFSVEFNKYVVLDNSRWPNEAYAMEREAFSEKMLAWKQSGYHEKYWSTIFIDSLPSAHDALLKLRSGSVLRLGFTGFERLYTKDLLTKI